MLEAGSPFRPFAVPPFRRFVLLVAFVMARPERLARVAFNLRPGNALASLYPLWQGWIRPMLPFARVASTQVQGSHPCMRWKGAQARRHMRANTQCTHTQAQRHEGTCRQAQTPRHMHAGACTQTHTGHGRTCTQQSQICGRRIGQQTRRGALGSSRVHTAIQYAGSIRLSRTIAAKSIAIRRLLLGLSWLSCVNT